MSKAKNKGITKKGSRLLNKTVVLFTNEFDINEVNSKDSYRCMISSTTFGWFVSRFTHKLLK